MAHWLKHSVLPEDPSSILSTHMAVHSCLELQFRGSDAFYRPLLALGTHRVTDRHAGITLILIKK